MQAQRFVNYYWSTSKAELLQVNGAGFISTYL